MVTSLQPSHTVPCCPLPASLVASPSLLVNYAHGSGSRSDSGKDFKGCSKRIGGKSRGGEGIVCRGWLLPVDPWAPTIDSQSIASQLFAFSLFPYLGFLYFITKSNSAPKLTLFGFYFLLAFVGATIPAGIYAKVHYGTSLSNVDWLHGGAESLLTLTNIFIVLGLRQALRTENDTEKKTSDDASFTKEENKSSI